MAVCDLILPILRPVKSPFQLGFTPGLFVILINEKIAWAMFNDLILLIQFLDAEAAFDRTLHPAILSNLFHDGVQDDQLRYFDLLHKNATTHIKWNSKINENIGNRQGGYSSVDEWKVYGNPTIKEIEEKGG